ncbi:MAG: hypothetical protein ACOX9A_03375 [Anaerolineae bacterium]|jgi:hypothetical protein
MTSYPDPQSLEQGNTIESDIDELRVSLMQGLCLACLVVSWIWLAISSIASERYYGAIILLPPFLVLFCSLAALVIPDPTGKSQFIRRGIFALGLILALAPGFPGRIGTFHWYLGSFTITAVGAVLGPSAAGVVAIAYNIILIYPGTPPSFDDLFLRAPALMVIKSI